MSFSFGQAKPTPTSSTFSFGAPAQPATSTPSLFGSTPAQPSSTSNLFGSSSASTSNPTPSTSLFGQSQSTPSLFGQSQPQSQPQSTPSLFGQQPPQSQPPQTSSLFGGQSNTQTQQPAVTSAPLFGQSQSAATSSLFGQSQSQPKPSLFGSSTTPQSQFGQPLLQQSQQQQPSQQTIPKLGEPLPSNPNEIPIETRLENIKQSFDPNHSKCRFQTYFYNEPGLGQSVKMYGRPPNGTDEAAWLKAVRENPDPEHLVPAIAIGFASLQKRIEHQQRQTSAHQQLLTEIHTHLDQLGSTHSLKTSLRTLRAQQNAVALSSRLMSLVGKTSGLSPGRNVSLKREEEELRIELERLSNKVEGVRTRGNELWSGVGVLKSRKKELEGLEWAVADEQGFKKILEILTSQQTGLDHLTKTLQTMTNDVDVMNEAFGLPQRNLSASSNGSGGAGGKSLMNSVSSQR